MTTLGILLAAGTSLRFGPDDKLLTPWRGGTLVGSSAAALAAAGCDCLAAVVSSETVASALPPQFQLIRIKPGKEMSISYQAACRHAESLEADRMLIALGDMPSLRQSTLRTLLEPGMTSKACKYGGTRMPPALLLSTDWRAALNGPGDHGARAAIHALPDAALVELDECEALDVDTKADLP